MKEQEICEETVLEEKEEVVSLEKEAEMPDQKEEDAFGELQKHIDNQQKEIEELNNRLLRMQADFDNYRRRSRKEMEAMSFQGMEQIILKLLPVIDNFERALEAVKDEQALEQFAEGVKLVYRQLKEVLEKEGLSVIPALNEPFDPEKHYAVAQIPTADYGDNIILEEIQKGYLLKDKVIRASTVCVSKNEETN